VAISTWRRIEHLADGEHVKGSGEDHSGNSDNGPFLAAALGDALVLDAV